MAQPRPSPLTQTLRYMKGPMLQTIASAVAEPLAGLHGLGALAATQNLDAATNTIEKTRNSISSWGAPTSEEGKQGVADFQEFMAPVGEALGDAETYLGENTLEATGSPALAALAHSAPTMLMELIGLKGARTASQGGRLGTQYEIGDLSAKPRREIEQGGILAGFKESQSPPMDNLIEAAQDTPTGKLGFEEDYKGVFKDDDGHWKWEIDDFDATLKQPSVVPADTLKKNLKDARKVKRDFLIDNAHLIRHKDEGIKAAYLTEVKRLEAAVLAAKQAQKSGGKAPAPTPAGVFEDLDAVFDHPELKAQYPEVFKDVQVDLNAKLDKGVWGQVAGNRLELSETLSAADKLETIMHELEHVIQGREGFAKGGSPDNMGGVKVRLNSQKKFFQEAAAQKHKPNDGETAYHKQLQLAKESLENLSDHNLDTKTGRHNAYESLLGEQNARLIEQLMKTKGISKTLPTKIRNALPMGQNPIVHRATPAPDAWLPPEALAAYLRQSAP